MKELKKLKEIYEKYRIEEPEPCFVDLIELGIEGIISRYRFVNKRLRKVIGKDDVILDIGCGTGYVDLKMNFARRVIGIDIAISALKQAKETLREIKRRNRRI